jgi:hypothetical protein
LFGKTDHSKCLEKIKQLEEENKTQTEMYFVQLDDIKKLKNKLDLYEEIHPDLKDIKHQGDVYHE